MLTLVKWRLKRRAHVCIEPCHLKCPPDFLSLKQRWKKIKDWIVNWYKSSTFNTCEHQPLPKMKGEPLGIYTREDGKPYVVHTHSPIPVHFQQEVKEQLDRDVRLGVLEKVPPNTPTTWCRRLVVATKKNGTPTRIVDLQAQNNGSVRQTHNTRNPYHVTREILPTLRRLLSTHGTVTIRCRCILTISITPRSSQNSGVTVIAALLKDT